MVTYTDWKVEGREVYLDFELSTRSLAWVKFANVSLHDSYESCKTQHWLWLYIAMEDVLVAGMEFAPVTFPYIWVLP